MALCLRKLSDLLLKLQTRKDFSRHSMVLENHILINSNLCAYLQKCDSLWSFPGRATCFSVILKLVVSKILHMRQMIYIHILVLPSLL